MSAVVEDFRKQADVCGDLGSDFTRQILLRGAEDIEAGGVVARLTADWPGKPRADAVSLRWAGSLHAAVLTGRDPALAAEYPAARADWSMDRIWPLADVFLRREEAWVRAFMQSPPQTNETARSTALAAGFMWLADRMPQPFHMLELGASAGLNLNWERFAYAYPRWGRRDVAGPLMPTEIRSGELPGWRDIAIASRAACDQNPLDASSPDHRLRLRAYVWARVVNWLRRKHPRANWKWLRRRYLPRWWPTEDDVTLFDPNAVPITWARYRGQIIDTTPWKPTVLT